MQGNHNFLTKSEIYAYFAGLFDGEGYVHISRDYGLHVAVGMTASAPLLLLLQEFGGSIYEEHRGKNKMLWRWVANGDTGARFLEKIYYSLVVKKTEAIIGFLFQDIVRQRKASTRPLSPKEREIRELFRVECSALKEFNT